MVIASVGQRIAQSPHRTQRSSSLSIAEAKAPEPPAAAEKPAAEAKADGDNT